MIRCTSTHYKPNGKPGETHDILVSQQLSIFSDAGADKSLYCTVISGLQSIQYLTLRRRRTLVIADGSLLLLP